MRLSFVLVLLLPSISFAQTQEINDPIERDLANKRTAKWVLTLEAPDGGFYIFEPDPKADAKPKPSLRATSAAVRTLKNLNMPLLPKEREKHAAFVLKCYDAKTGAFSEPGLEPDVAITSVGVMAAMELGIPKEKFAKAMDYLKENAKNFEEVRIGAGAVEAWGVKDCPFKFDEWVKIITKEPGEKNPAINDGGARILGSTVAFLYRLDIHEADDAKPEEIAKVLNAGQLDDGGWNRKGEKTSDIETTYRVMRAYMLIKQKPKDVKKLRKFIDSHRNEDGGYAVKPGDKSSVSGVYYCIIISKWLDELEK